MSQVPVLLLLLSCLALIHTSRVVEACGPGSGGSGYGGTKAPGNWVAIPNVNRHDIVKMAVFAVNEYNKQFHWPRYSYLRVLKAWHYNMDGAGCYHGIDHRLYIKVREAHFHVRTMEAIVFKPLHGNAFKLLSARML